MCTDGLYGIIFQCFVCNILLFTVEHDDALMRLCIIMRYNVNMV